MVLGALQHPGDGWPKAARWLALSSCTKPALESHSPAACLVLFWVQGVFLGRLLLALLSSLKQGDGFPSRLPLHHWVGGLEGDLGHAAPALVAVIYSSLDGMPLLRP